MKQSNSKEEKPKLIEHESGMLECPCGNIPISHMDLIYDTVETRTPAGEIGRLITRAYYECFICNREFDLKKTKGTGHWNYEDGVPNKDRVKLETSEDFSKALSNLKDE